MSTRTPHRDAIRILYVLQAGGTPWTDPCVPDVVSIFKGETRLLAFDFWMRNPDYLAAELLELFEQTGDSGFLQAVETIFDDDEPNLSGAT